MKDPTPLTRSHIQGVDHAIHRTPEIDVLSVHGYVQRVIEWLMLTRSFGPCRLEWVKRLEGPGKVELRWWLLRGVPRSPGIRSVLRPIFALSCPYGKN